MSVFADSSALVKLYLDEVGHELARTLPQLAVAQLARVEVASALWRKARLGELDPAEATVLSEEFEADFYGTDATAPRFAVIVASDEVLDSAARLITVHELRAYDAVQLASALALRQVDATATRLCAFDRRLLTAARAEGLETTTA